MAGMIFSSGNFSYYTIVCDTQYILYARKMLLNPTDSTSALNLCDCSPGAESWKSWFVEEKCNKTDTLYVASLGCLHTPQKSSTFPIWGNSVWDPFS